MDRGVVSAKRSRCMTYPSSSLVVLMQAAGRCVRYAEGKAAAYVLQAKNTALAYHHDQRWLYQEISDYLRPRLEDVDYGSMDELHQRLAAMLEAHHVAAEVRHVVEQQAVALKEGETCRLLLTGLPFFGSTENFERDACWSALLETPGNRERFRRIFNNFCALGAPSADPRPFLQLHIAPSTNPVSEWQLFYTMLLATHYAARELFGSGPLVGAPRPFEANGELSPRNT
jgi:hypothetical protein